MHDGNRVKAKDSSLAEMVNSLPFYSTAQLNFQQKLKSVSR